MASRTLETENTEGGTNMKKNIIWKTKGMNKDTSVSAFNPEFAFDNVNIRLSTNEKNTMLSWVNERGPKLMRLKIDTQPWSREESEDRYTTVIEGVPIGTAILYHQLVVFSTDSKGTDCIYVFNATEEEEYDLYGRRLFKGELGLDKTSPIETLVSYESENIQKVYWTDNKNQPRVINIAPSMTSKAANYYSGSFDFVQELSLQEEVTVTKILGSGEFPAGVIQYAFTYYNKYGQESNIFHVTPLQYIAYKDRAGSPDAKIANSFRIHVSKVDTHFDYLRVYSILRTSLNATPLVKRVQDIQVEKTEVQPESTKPAYAGTIGTLSTSTVKVSLNAGNTFNEASSFRHLYTDTDCPAPSNTKYQDRTYWGELAYSSTPAHVYMFKQSEYPDLILQVGSQYFTWAEGTSDALIYLGLASHTGILIGEYADGTQEVNISQYATPQIYSHVTMIDDGTMGDTVDPTELLYKGGEEITAKTMEQKDGTLFLGNIFLRRPSVPYSIKKGIQSLNGILPDSPLAQSNVFSLTVHRPYLLASAYPHPYVNTLNGVETEEYTGAATFKYREYYRLGVQFQYKNGKWSEPVWIGDKQNTSHPVCDEGGDNAYFSTKGIGVMAVPEFQYKMNYGIKDLYKKGYRRVRGLMAVPGIQDRTILCQGVACPTVYRKVDRWSDASGTDTGVWTGKAEGNLYAQSSWLFRTPIPGSSYGDSTTSGGGGAVTPDNRLLSQYDQDVIRQSNSSPEVVSPFLRSTEVMGKYDDGHAFYADSFLVTIHSPDLIFEDAYMSMDFKGCSVEYVGYTELSATFGDISIQTSTPAIGSDAAGFVHKSLVVPGYGALITGLFYNDSVVDDLDDTPRYGAFNSSLPPVDWPVYMWHKNGSLNNDVARSGRSAELLKKKISNYRLGNSSIYQPNQIKDYTAMDIQMFSSTELSMIKVNGHTYQGNIDTMVTPTEPSAYYIVGSPWRETVDTDFLSRSYYKLCRKDPKRADSIAGIWIWEKEGSDRNWWWNSSERADVGREVKGLNQWREGVSIKYKSTPHLVAAIHSTIFSNNTGSLNTAFMPIVEVTKSYNPETLYGGFTDEALQSNTWIPCGPSVQIRSGQSEVDIPFKWGDTYYQRFECLKTYPFTQEDKNQVVEIASFIIETRVNIDGRYDRNRGQVSNLNMTPQNFNLLNPVYSQMDNFFSYKILDEDNYDNMYHPNNVTWTKTKQNGADTDLWTNLTLANIVELDGDSGAINKLIRMNNQLLSFQDSGISQILYNENTQISTTEGVPIEIANSEKVQGKRYLSNTVGCSNKWSIVQTPVGIYFMDSHDKSIYLFNGQLSNLSTAGGFNTWVKQWIPSADKSWNPVDFGNFAVYYDKLNQDLLFINGLTALAYSEKFNCFTSFYDYGGVPYLNSLDDLSIWIDKDGKLWQHQAGEYCKFFGTNQGYSLTLIANQEPQADKIFTNLEFRACVEGEGEYDKKKDLFTPILPFDNIEVWNEYQHGILTLSNRESGSKYNHSTQSNNTLLNRKFRIWRCDIPRDNAPVRTALESSMGIKRFKARPLDRMRNPWIYLKLQKNAADKESTLHKTEIHDIMVSYFG